MKLYHHPVLGGELFEEGFERLQWDGLAGAAFEPDPAGLVRHGDEDDLADVQPLQPLDVAHAAGAHRDVTWDEVMQQRRERQAERLARLREPVEPDVLPCYVWTFYNVQDIPYGGWHCYLITREHGDLAARGKYGTAAWLAENLMTEIQLGILPMVENFTTWMAMFAKKYPRARRWPDGKVFHHGQRDPRKAGVLHGWLKDRTTFSIQRPNDL